VSLLISSSQGFDLNSTCGDQQTTNNIVRTIGSAVSNSLFSLSIDKGYLGGYMAYVVFVFITVMSLCATSLLPRDENLQSKR
jgi:hypothetical protein